MPTSVSKTGGGVYMDLFNNMLVSSMDKSLDGLWRRQEVISENIANFETPGYKRKFVSFEDELKSVFDSQELSKQERLSEIQDSQINVKRDESFTMRQDGNSVDVEQENVEMARTTFQYMYSQRVLNDHFSRLRMAISEGQRS